MENYPKVAIIYLSYHCEPYMDDVVSALKKLTYPKDKVELVIVDNPHPEYGSSVRFIQETVMPLSGKELPHVTLLPQKENLGFAGGNNAGVDWALEHGFDYCFFHNNDGFIAANALEPLVEHMEQNEDVAMAQSLMLLHPETNLINSSGNTFHYLGFGYTWDNRTPLDEANLPAVKEISYASGAALMMRSSLIKEHGAWDEDFFLYHEDLEWSFRMRAIGLKAVMVRDSVFYHKYQFSRSIQKFYWMERNRHGVMLMFFRLPTLLLLLPMALVLEAGLWVFSFKNKYWRERVRVYKYWLKWDNWKPWLKKRKRIQKMRSVRDRDLFAMSSYGIFFQDDMTKNPLLVYVGNPIMKLYYTIVVRGLIWW